MNSHRKLISRLATPLALAVGLTVGVAAKAPAASGSAASAIALSAITIDNFGKVDDAYYRGGQPDRDEYGELSKLGVKTVIDLQADGHEKEKSLVEHAGMAYYRIPLTTRERPSDAAVKTFLSIVDDPSKQPVYVHCAGGQHRTGVMTAVYRMTKYGWNEDKAYDEMKQYKFETFIGHPQLRSFVHDFYEKLVPVASKVVAAAPLPAANTAIAGQP
jgi:protein tyrosine/serine phosphatase